MVKATTEEKNAAKAERKACASKKAGKGSRQVFRVSVNQGSVRRSLDL